MPREHAHYATCHLHLHICTCTCASTFGHMTSAHGTNHTRTWRMPKFCPHAAWHIRRMAHAHIMPHTHIEEDATRTSACHLHIHTRSICHVHSLPHMPLGTSWHTRMCTHGTRTHMRTYGTWHIMRTSCSCHMMPHTHTHMAQKQ
jgi:hypothetical protein